MNGAPKKLVWTSTDPVNTRKGYGEVSQEGLQFYIDLAKEIHRQGLEPIVTLFYWDLPMQIQLHYGGFSNEQIVNDFARYAETVFKALAPHGVKRWFTFNSP